LLDKIAPVSQITRQYTYKWRPFRPKYPEFRTIVNQWETLAEGEVRQLPRTKYLCSHSYHAHFAYHFKKEAMRRSLYIGYHFGIMTDVKNQCLVLIKLRDGFGLPNELFEEVNDNALSNLWTATEG
jgi:hypothetical protein